jgi:DNA-binding MarR family transcriptional regulator
LKKQDSDIVQVQEPGMAAGACICAELRKAARAVTLLYDNAFKSTGLLSTQLSVLRVISKSESIRVSQLAEELGMDRTTLTRNLSVLERRGFIKISSGKDHRTRIVTITFNGSTSIAKTIPLWNKVQRKVKKQMGENAWRELMQNLSQFVKITDQLNVQ